jgi:hypothetical protein
MSIQPTLDTNRLADLVRTWVHFDNLAATFTRQAQQARTARSRSEGQIIDNLKASHMENATIQISGGRLTIHDERHANPLTLQRLEVLLHEYFNTKPSGSEDETSDIMKYIKEHRGFTIETKLKKN